MQRPDTVPEDATWESDSSEWQQAARDADGEFHGQVTWWRPDGTRCCVTAFTHGTADGDFNRYHDNGETSRHGRYDGGQLTGTHTFSRSTEATTETFPPGLSDAVWRCEMDYVANQIGEARAYDREGARVLEDGSPFPTEIPDGVPTSAHFRKREADSEWRWVEGKVRDNDDGTIARLGRWRFWTPQGVLVSDETYADGALHGVSRTYDEESGTLLTEVTWCEGDETGPFECRAEPGRYADSAIVLERGAQVDGTRTGVLELVDADGGVVATCTLGDECDQGAIGDVLGADVPGDLIPMLLEQGQGGVAVLAAVLAGASPEALNAQLAALQPPLSEEGQYHETRRAKMIAHNVVRFGGGPVQVLDSLMDGVRAGGDAGELLRQAAASIDDMGHEALATTLIDAACTLQPDERGHEYTRSLIRMSQGDPDGAAQSIARLAEANPEAGAMMRSYRAALFADLTLPVTDDPRLEAAQAIAAHLTPNHRESAPPAAVVRRTLQQIASRIAYARQGIAERFGDVPWAPPSLDHLLPDGPVETPLPEGGAIGLLHAARRDMLRFNWLCWSLGLDGKFLPDTVAVDTDRPSRALGLVVLARAMQLEDSEPDVSGWIEDVAEAPRAALAAELVARTPKAQWYGMALEDCDHAAKQFAFDDELVLFKMLLQWWNNSDEATLYELEAQGEE